MARSIGRHKKRNKRSKAARLRYSRKLEQNPPKKHLDSQSYPHPESVYLPEGQMGVQAQSEPVAVQNEPKHEDLPNDYETTTALPLEFLPESAEVEVSEMVKTSVRRKTLPTGTAFCRLCLKPANKVGMVSLTTLDVNYCNKPKSFKNKSLSDTEKCAAMIRTLMPSFDFDLVYNPIMCNVCCTQLKQACHFVEQTMKSQDTIEDYKKQHVMYEEMVLCEDVVKFKDERPTRSQKMKSSDLGPPKKKKVAKKIHRKSGSASRNYNHRDADDLRDYHVTAEELMNITIDRSNEETPHGHEDKLKIEIEPCNIESGSFSHLELACFADGDLKIDKSESSCDNEGSSFGFDLTNKEHLEITNNSGLVMGTSNVNLKKCHSVYPSGIPSASIRH